MKTSLFDTIGGPALRKVMEDFYERVFDDVMIGFMFWGKDKARLIQKEWEFTARLLGADIAYTGKSMPKAHAHAPILGGHFARRLQILKETLIDHKVDSKVQDKWIAHTIALRSVVTADEMTECNDVVSPQPGQGGEFSNSNDAGDAGDAVDAVSKEE